MSIATAPTAGATSSDGDVAIIGRVESSDAPASRDAQIAVLQSEVRYLCAAVAALSARLDVLSHVA